MSWLAKQRGGYVSAFLCWKIMAISLNERNDEDIRPSREGIEPRYSRVSALTLRLAAENAYNIFERKMFYFEI